MISPKILPLINPDYIGLSDTASWYIKDRSKANIYKARRLLESQPNGATAPALTELQKKFAGLKFAPFRDVTGLASDEADIIRKDDIAVRLQQVQELLAQEDIFLSSDKINEYFFDDKGEPKKSLFAEPKDEKDSAPWGNVLIQIQLDAVKDFNAQVASEPQPDEKFQQIFKKLEGQLEKLTDPKHAAKSRNDLWVELNKDEKGESATEEALKKAGFTQEEYNRNIKLVRREFMLSPQNKSFYAEKDGKFLHASAFREQVLKDNPGGQPFSGVHFEPLHSGYQPPSSTGLVTYRGEIKASPFGMDQLAILMNAATKPKFNGNEFNDTPGVLTNAAIQQLTGKDNPFAKTIFTSKDGREFYIMGAYEVSGTLTVTKQPIKVTGEPPKPYINKNGEYEVHSQTGPSRWRASDTFYVYDPIEKKRADDPVKIVELFQSTVETLIKGCGFGVREKLEEGADEEVALKVTANEEKYVPKPAIYKFNNTPLLKDWLLTPGLGLHLDTNRRAIYSAATQALTNISDIDDAMQAFGRGAGIAPATPEQEQLLYHHFNTHPEDFAALEKAAAKAAAASNTPAVDKVINRHKNTADFKAMSPQDRSAALVLFWGKILAKFLEMVKNGVDNTTIANTLKELIVKEQKTGAYSNDQLPIPIAFGLGGDVERDHMLNLIMARCAEEVRNANKGGGSTLFLEQRKQLSPIIMFYNHSPDHHSVSKIEHQLSLNPISFDKATSLKIQPMSKPMQALTNEDKRVIEALVWTAIVRDCIDKLQSNSSTLGNELAEIIQQHYQIAGMKPGKKVQDLLKASASMSPDQLLQKIIINDDSPFQDAIALTDGTPSTLFTPEIIAARQIADELQGLPKTVEGFLQEDYIKEKTYENAFDKAEPATLVEELTLLRYKDKGDENSATGFILQNGGKGDHEVYVAGSTSLTKILDNGLIELQKSGKDIIVENDKNEKLYFVSTGADPKTGEVNVQLLKNKADLTSAYTPANLEESVRLQNAIHIKLVEASGVNLSKHVCLTQNPANLENHLRQTVSGNALVPEPDAAAGAKKLKI